MYFLNYKGSFPELCMDALLHHNPQRQASAEQLVLQHLSEQLPASHCPT